MIFGWWLSLLALLGYIPTAAEKIEEAAEKAEEERGTKRDIDEARRITEATDAAIAEHKRRHEP